VENNTLFDDLPPVESAVLSECYQKIYVHFEKYEDLLAFGELIGLPLNSQSRFLSWPLPGREVEYVEPETTNPASETPPTASSAGKTKKKQAKTEEITLEAEKPPISPFEQIPQLLEDAKAFKSFGDSDATISLIVRLVCALDFTYSAITGGREGE
jgi:hypothetical protein